MANSIPNRKEFLEKVLPANEGVIIIKFGAEWCGPCKAIKELVEHHFQQMPSQVACYDIDVDEHFDLFAYLKSRKMIAALPAIVSYEKGNVHYAPDKIVIGANPDEINIFFGDYKKKYT